MSGIRWKTLAAAVGLMASVACAGKGCSCTEPIKGGFAVAERHESAIQLRATQGLFKYFSDNGASIIPSLLPTGTTFNVPPSCGGSNPICCTTPAPMCRINFDFKDLSLQPTAPNVVKLSTNLVLKTMDNLPVGILGGTCFISIDTTRSGGPTMNVAADLTFPVNKTTDSTEISAMNAAVTGIDNGDLKTDEAGSTPFLCSAIGLVATGIIISTLESQVATQIQNTISQQTCMTCMDKTDCNSFASDCVMGTCVQADGKTCVQEVGLDGRMDIGKSLAAFSPNTKAKMDVMAVLGGYASADTGLSLGMLGGGYADPHSSCVPMRTRAAPPPITPSTTFTTDVLPDGATGYHLGIGVHRSHLDTLGFSAWDSGALCLDVGTPSVALLTAKTIGVVIPSLGDLVHGKDAPMFLVIRPQDPPTFSMGKGTFKLDVNGQKIIDDALLHIHVPNFNIDFFAFVDERYVRVMTLTADLELPVALDVDATNKIVPLLGDLTQAFTNVSVTNSELLAEAPADLAKTFPMLLGLAGGQLSSVLSPIALPALMGINIKPIAITSTDPDTDGANQYLSIFANLSTGTPLSLGAETEARLIELTLPATRGFAVDARSAAQPQARLQLGGQSIDGLPLEFSYQVDESGWSPFTSATTLDVTHPLLWLQGRHHVDVRARAAGVPESLDLTPARVELLVDTIAPEGSFDGSYGELVVSATDRVSPHEALVYRWRSSGGEYSMWSALDRLPIDPAIPLDTIDVQARDEAGNIGVIQFHGRTTAPAASGCGCDVGGAAPSPTGGLLLILAALSGLFVVRRRRLALFVLLGLAGCNDGLGKGEFVNNIDEIGRFHDVVARNGEFFVSAYDDSVGDLVYAHIKDLSKPVSWQDIDGVDLTAPVDTPGDYRHGINDPGPDVGLYTSIALTKAGEPRIAYYDVTNAALKFAAGPGHFRVSTVETGANNVQVGLYAALTLDDADIPSIAYMATGISDGKSGFKSELRLATATNANPGDADWTISKVDSTAIPCAGHCGAGTACVQTAMVNMMPNGDPSISTCVTVDAAPCATACADTQACIATVCTAFLATPKAPDLPEGTGLFTQARRVNGKLDLIYYDHSQGDLKLATGAPGGTFTVSILDGNDPTTDVGQFCSAQAAMDGTLHVAYVDAVGDRLLYKTVSGGTALMTAEVIDDGVRDDGPHPVGAGAALVLDGGNPRVVYQDQQVSDLLEARRGGSSWTHTPVVTGVAGYGWWPHITADSGKLYLSQFVYDRENGSGALGTLQISALP